jgi:hypothetical protein
MTKWQNNRAANVVNGNLAKPMTAMAILRSHFLAVVKNQ